MRVAISTGYSAAICFEVYDTDATTLLRLLSNAYCLNIKSNYDNEITKLEMTGKAPVIRILPEVLSIEPPAPDKKELEETLKKELAEVNARKVKISEQLEALT